MGAVALALGRRDGRDTGSGAGTLPFRACARGVPGEPGGDRAGVVMGGGAGTGGAAAFCGLGPEDAEAAVRGG